MQPVLPVQATRPARMALASMARPSASIPFCAALSLAVGTPEISRFCQTVSLMSPSPRSRATAGNAAHLRDRHAADRHRDADPIEAILLLRMDADMGGAVEGRARRQGAGHGTVELAAELLFHEREEFLNAQAVEHVFQPRLGAVGAVAVCR